MKEDLESYSPGQIIQRQQEIMTLITSLCDRRTEDVEVDTTFSTMYPFINLVMN